MDFDIDPVLRGNDVTGIDGLAAEARCGRKFLADGRFQLMLENSAKRSEIDTVRFIEIEIFVTRAHENPSLAESFRAISEHGSEARGFLHDSIGKDESGNGRRQRHLAELHADLCIDGTEVIDAGSLEVNFVEHRSRERPSIVDTHQAAGAVNLRNNADQVRRSLGGGTQDFLGWAGALSQSCCGENQR